MFILIFLSVIVLTLVGTGLLPGGAETDRDIPEGFVYVRELIPDAVIEIAEETYFNSGVECVTLPETCAKIDSKAFASCASLKLIEIPAGVTDIAGDAFEDTTDFVIVTTAGTAAETFAKQNGIDCLILHQ